VSPPATGPDAPDTGPTCGRLRADDSMAGTGRADAAVGVRVLDAAGIGPRRTVYAAGSSVTMIGEPSAAGARTAGLPTTVRITGRVVTGATGWLPQLGDGVSYPVVDAQTAWERLRHTLLPQTLIACTEPAPAGTDPLLCGGPAKVTGAQLGRSLQHAADGSAVLVPAWLFRVSGRAAGYPVVALPDRLLRGPSVAGGGTSGSPGTASDLPTTTVAPPTPIRGPGKDPVSPEPANPGSRFSGVRAVGPDELTVSFTGGVDDCYGYQVVAKETATQVRLSLTETVTSGKACIDLAQVYDRSVPLSSALAGRSVVDGESGAVLLTGSGG